MYKKQCEILTCISNMNENCQKNMRREHSEIIKQDDEKKYVSIFSVNKYTVKILMLYERRS